MKTDLPGIVLRDWSDKKNAVVLMLKVFLTVDCEIVGLQLEAEKDRETDAALAAFKLGKLGKMGVESGTVSLNKKPKDQHEDQGRIDGRCRAGA